MKISDQYCAKHLYIAGRVQGVGFRPFIHHHAKHYELSGWVRNSIAGVEICIEGTPENCRHFIHTLKENAPKASVVSQFHQKDTDLNHYKDFQILHSNNGEGEVTNISPDIAVCERCLLDIKTQEHRYDYPFTNCTHCGPRFSIIRDLPYDRKKTSMVDFTMCEACKREYKDINDRRFHAQPVSCIRCGPQYKWVSKTSQEMKWDKILKELAGFIKQGKIIAIKSTGGFQLICDAENQEAIMRLRNSKQRHVKPFAVMFSNIQSIRKFARLSLVETQLLQSWRRPVVVLQAISSPSQELNRGFSTIGAILPYTPLHYLLMEQISNRPVVFTSANLKGNPLIRDNQKALELLEQDHCDAVLYHNRQVENTLDDSIVQSANDHRIIIRRARGYVPEPVYVRGNVEGILALGADMKNTFCIGKDQRAILSQYIGDLDHYEVFQRYKNTIEKYKALFRFQPKCIVSDLHPQYHSSIYARQAGSNENHPSCKKISVQHHHAHIASVMAEHGLDEQVIGVAMDGTGYGEDGNIWGSEFMICDLQHFERMAHMDYLPLAGGEKAIREPWRIAIVIAYEIFGENYHEILFPVLNYTKQKHIQVLKAWQQKINIAYSCGMGRLFDVVAVLLNLLENADFEGEGPLKLENIHISTKASYPFCKSAGTYDYLTVLKGVFNDILAGVPASEISGKFHNSIANMIIQEVQTLAKNTGISKVILSGGVFQNRVLINNVLPALQTKGYQVYINEQVPCNDGGISLGQLMIASKKI